MVIRTAGLLRAHTGLAVLAALGVIVFVLIVVQSTQQASREFVPNSNQSTQNEQLDSSGSQQVSRESVPNSNQGARNEPLDVGSLSGRASVVDGDTIDMHKVRVPESPAAPKNVPDLPQTQGGAASTRGDLATSVQKTDDPAGRAATIDHLDPAKEEDAQPIQQRLIELGFLAGIADGVWGQRSRAALRAFVRTQQLGDSDTWTTDVQKQLFSAGARRAPVSPQPGFVGRWGLDVNECREARGRGPLTISANRAEAFGGLCEFASTAEESPTTWRVKAACSYKGERWTANIKFSSNGTRLTWSSERGVDTYVRCTQ